MSLHWLVEGYGYDITSADVMLPSCAALKLGKDLGRYQEVQSQLDALLARERPGGFVGKVLKGVPRR